MRYNKLLAATGLLASLSASAQVAPYQLVTTFALLDTSVPLGEWMPLALATLLVAAAIIWRRRAGLAARVLTITTVAALVAGSAVQMRDADAISVAFPITLTSSPNQTDITSNVGIATNLTGQSIRITGVSVVAGPAQSSQSCPLQIVPGNTTCNSGAVLSPGGTCQVEVQCPF